MPASCGCPHSSAGEFLAVWILLGCRPVVQIRCQSGGYFIPLFFRGLSGNVPRVSQSRGDKSQTGVKKKTQNKWKTPSHRSHRVSMMNNGSRAEGSTLRYCSYKNEKLETGKLEIGKGESQSRNTHSHTHTKGFRAISYPVGLSEILNWYIMIIGIDI